MFARIPEARPENISQIVHLVIYQDRTDRSRYLADHGFHPINQGCRSIIQIFIFFCAALHGTILGNEVFRQIRGYRAWHAALGAPSARGIALCCGQLHHRSLCRMLPGHGHGRIGDECADSEDAHFGSGGILRATLRMCHHQPSLGTKHNERVAETRGSCRLNGGPRIGIARSCTTRAGGLSNAASMCA